MENYNYSFNKERLKRYIVNEEDTKEDIINLYIWNIKLSKELYPLISLLEITLRNHINNAINKNISNNWLLSEQVVKRLLTNTELKTYIEAFQKLNHKQKLTEGRLIAELGLGFWTNLFNKKYKVSIWHKKGMFESTFPYFDIKTSNRIGYIYPKLKEVQYIRNRISHHEAIFDYPKGLYNCYTNILLLLGWLSPEIKNLSNDVSNFTKIWEEKINLIKNY